MSKPKRLDVPGVPDLTQPAAGNPAQRIFDMLQQAGETDIEHLRPMPSGPATDPQEAAYDVYLGLLQRQTRLLDRLEAAVQRIEAQYRPRSTVEEACVPRRPATIQQTPQYDAGEIWGQGLKERTPGT